MKRSLLPLVFLISACGNVNIDSPEPSNGPLFSKDITDRSICQSPTPPVASIYRNGWSANFEAADGTTYNQKVFISQNSISEILVCRRGQAAAVAQIQAPLVVNYTELQIQASVDHEQVLDDGKTQTSCRVSFTKDQRFQFRFEGPCLNLQDLSRTADESITYIPAL